MKKSIFSCFIIIVLLLSSIPVYATQNRKITSLDYYSLEDYSIDFAKKTFQYFMFDNDDIFEFELNDLIDSYLINKKKVLNFNSSIYGLKKIEDSITAKILDHTEIDDTIIYTINIISDYYYRDNQSEKSTLATNIIVKIDKNQNSFSIDRIFDDIGGFDIEIWSDLDSNIKSSVDTTTRSMNMGINEVITPEHIENKAKSIINEIKANYDMNIELMYKNKNFEIENLEIVPMSSINKTNVKNYARNNYNKTPSSGGSGVPYYDFSKIDAAYDCTNFVSHALLAGGANPKYTSTGWYYRSLSDRTPSWSGVTQLHSYLVTSTTGLRGTSSSYFPYAQTDSALFSDGDILQFNNGSIWRHSTIITGRYGIYYNGRSSYGALVTGRTSSTQYNNNSRAEDIMGTNAKRIIRITGI
ncbi:MAG: hypothetical protein EOM07_04295 [Clostridia bacterium]|nr:hypothetical protein [Clostridia bacterium]